MSTYVILMKLTEQGIKDIKNAPQRVKKVSQALEAAGGKVLAFYVVMGDYDYVAVAEAPGDEVAMAQLLGMAKMGTVRTTTLKAFTLEEFSQVLEKLP